MTTETVRKPWWEQYKVDIPEQTRGRWSIEKFTVERDSLENMRIAMSGRRECPPGTYTRLVRNPADPSRSWGRTVVMSDTLAEITDHLEFFRQATGRVLIHGLGLGMAVNAVLAKEDVTHVDVVEIDEDIIAMVGPHYQDPRLVIHHGDARTFKWPAGMRWDAVWHDIWDNIVRDNLEEMHRFHRSFGKRSAWQGSWGRPFIR